MTTTNCSARSRGPLACRPKFLNLNGEQAEQPTVKSLTKAGREIITFQQQQKSPLMYYFSKGIQGIPCKTHNYYHHYYLAYYL